MMTAGRLLIAFILALTSISLQAQQDPLYSQYMFNMQAINPAYTGIHNNLNIAVTSRFQWGGLDGSPKTNTLSVGTSLLSNKIGLGFTVLRDELGVNENTEAQLSYSFKISSPGFTFAMGLQTGIVNYKYNYNNLTLRFLDDPNFQPVSEGITKVNFGGGAALMTDNLFVGLSVPRILNQDFEDGNLKSTRYERHYYLTGAYIIELQRGIRVKPMVLIRGVQGAPISFDLSGSVLLNNRLWVGIFTRDITTYGLLGQFELKDNLKLGYSFEIPNGDFIANNLLTHEITVTIDLAVFPDHDVFQRFF